MIIDPYRYASASTLLDGLVSWWSLDEASGTRVDSHGSNNLTDNNTVGSATGKISTAASFVQANSEYLSGTASLPGGSFSFAAWVQPTSGGVAFYPYFEIDASGDACDVFAFQSKWQCRTQGNTILDSGVATSAGVWAFVVFGHDGSTAFISVNGGAKSTLSNGALTFAATENFNIGKQLNAGNYFDGLVDEAALWNRELTAAEITELYNSGNGIGYPG